MTEPRFQLKKSVSKSEVLTTVLLPPWYMTFFSDLLHLQDLGLGIVSFSCLLTFNASSCFATTADAQHPHWASWLSLSSQGHSCLVPAFPSFSVTPGGLAIALIHLVFFYLLTSPTPSVWNILSSLPPFQLIKNIPQPSRCSPNAPSLPPWNTTFSVKFFLVIAKSQM